MEEKQPEEEPKEIFEDFDTDLFTQPPKREFADHEASEEPETEQGVCPFYPKACYKADTSQCTKECEHNPENYMDPKVKEVFDTEPWSNYCFTCGEFVPSRQHEEALDPPELIYSHTVATGYHEYRVKLAQWVLGRMKGKE